MNRIEQWINDHKKKRPSSWHWRRDGYYIEDIIPSVYECYAIIYHPYYLPNGQLITNEQAEQNHQMKLVIHLNKEIEKEFKIPFSQLPNSPYDIEEKIRTKVSSSLYTEEQLEKKIKKFSDRMLKHAFKPLQDLMDGKELEEDKEVTREGKWSEVFKFYRLDFNTKSSWYDTYNLESSKKIANAQMPAQDFLPVSILIQLRNFLHSNGVEKLDVNLWNQTIEPRSLLNADSENVKYSAIVKEEAINIISATNREWIFVNPHDYCRTIVGGSVKFIDKLRAETTLEISDNLRSTHRINSYFGE